MRRRQGENAQAVLEMALVLPLMIILTLGVLALFIQVRAQAEFNTALSLASQATVRAPVGNRTQSMSDANYAFNHSLDPYGAESAYFRVTGPLTCSGPYLDGTISNQPVTCTANAALDFNHTPVGILIHWQVNLSGTGTATPSVFRRCDNPVAVNDGSFQC